MAPCHGAQPENHDGQRGHVRRAARTRKAGVRRLNTHRKRPGTPRHRPHGPPALSRTSARARHKPREAEADGRQWWSRLGPDDAPSRGRAATAAQPTAPRKRGLARPGRCPEALLAACSGALFQPHRTYEDKANELAAMPSMGTTRDNPSAGLGRPLFRPCQSFPLPPCSLSQVGPS